jgi:hypothetical protein
MKNKSGKVGKWFDLELLNGFLPASIPLYLTPGYMLDEIGFVHLRGAVTHNGSDGGGHAQGTIARVPPIYRPERSQHDTTVVNSGAIDLGNTSSRFYIAGPGASHGNMSANGMAAGAGWINLSGVSWWVGKERLRQL